MKITLFVTEGDLIQGIKEQEVLKSLLKKAVIIATPPILETMIKQKNIAEVIFNSLATASANAKKVTGIPRGILKKKQIKWLN